ncbi:spinster family MFS transporter [Massilia putida]|uniref:spinster family MFS transporter n=1 Tax=Massilia putida TaxID=1141883 RepID=UPI000950E03F|nr:MFS transporter [Massilia putida]
MYDHQSAPDARAYPPAALAWYALFVFIVAATLAFVDKSIITLLVAPVRQSLGVSDTGISLLQGLSFVLLYSVMGIPSGYLVDRMQRRKLLSAGIALWSVMTVLCGFANSFAELFLARVGVGIGEAILMPAVFSLLADFFPSSQRGRANGIFTISTFAGGQGALIIGGLVLKSFHGADFDWPLLGLLPPWKSAFIAVGLPGLLVALLVLTIKEPLRQQVAAQSGTGALAGESLLAYLKQRRAMWLAIFGTFSLCAFSAYAVLSWIPTFFARKYGLPPASAGVLIGSVVMPGGIAGCLVSGVLSDWLKTRGAYGSRMQVFVFSWFITIPCIAALPFLGDYHLALVACGLFGFANAMAVASMPSVLQDVTRNQMRGKITAVHLLLVSIFGMALGPTATALVTDRVFQNDQGLIYAISITPLPAMLLGLVLTVYGMRFYQNEMAALVKASTAAEPEFKPAAVR